MRGGRGGPTSEVEPTDVVAVTALRLFGESEVVADPIINDSEDRDTLVRIDLEEVLLVELKVERLSIEILVLILETDSSAAEAVGVRKLRLRLAREILLDPDTDLVVPTIGVHHNDRGGVEGVARFNTPLSTAFLGSGDRECPGALRVAEGLHVEDLDSILELSTVTVEFIDKRLEHIEVELIAEDGEVDDLVEVGTAVLQHVLAVLADEVSAEALECDRVAQPARTVVEEALNRVLVVAGDDHHLVTGGEDPIEEGQDRFLSVTVVKLLELIEDDDSLLLNALHRPHEALVREGSVDDDGGQT